MLEDAPSAFGSDWQSARALPLSHFRDQSTDNPESFITAASIWANLSPLQAPIEKPH